MSNQAIVIVVLVGVAAAIVAAIALWRIQRRRRLQDGFGSEYERAVESAGSVRAGEAELLAREKRHASFDLQPLDPAARESYATRWATVQELFVDDPESAVGSAEKLVTALMADRGYPVDEDDEQRIADLSVEHGETVSRYREAVEISMRSAAGEASTEDLRQAMVHYRALFAELLEAPPGELEADRTEFEADRTDAEVVHTDDVDSDVHTDVDEDRLDVPRSYADADEPDQAVLGGQRDRERAELDETNPLDHRRPA